MFIKYQYQYHAKNFTNWMNAHWKDEFDLLLGEYYKSMLQHHGKFLTKFLDKND